MQRGAHCTGGLLGAHAQGREADAVLAVGVWRGAGTACRSTLEEASHTGDEGVCQSDPRILFVLLPPLDFQVCKQPTSQLCKKLTFVAAGRPLVPAWLGAGCPHCVMPRVLNSLISDAHESKPNHNILDVAPISLIIIYY